MFCGLLFVIPAGPLEICQLLEGLWRFSYLYIQRKAYTQTDNRVLLKFMPKIINGLCNITYHIRVIGYLGRAFKG